MATTAENAARLGLEVEVQIVRANGKNVPGDARTGQHQKLTRLNNWTVHETGNPRPGMNAQAHRNFVANGGGENEVSFSYCVDSDHAIQILPDDARQVAQGNAIGNRESASCETCVNSDGDWDKTLDNLAKLTAAFLVAHGLPLSAVRQHNSWSGKNCPQRIRATPGGWQALQASVDRYMVVLTAPPEPPGDRAQINGIDVLPAFALYWFEHGGPEIFGWPIRPVETEVLEDGNSYQVQYFERARMELHPGGRVLLGRLGAEVLKLRAA